MNLEFDVKITASVLYDYMIHHTYTGLSGIFGTMVGIFILVAYFTQGAVIYLIAGIFILSYLPVTLYMKAKTQAITNPAFKNSLHYTLTEEGMEVSQDGEAQIQLWEDMVKAVSTKSSIIVYTSPVNASIFPRKDLGGQTTMVIQFISTHMSPNKVKIRG